MFAEDEERRRQERDHRRREDEGRRVTLHRLDDLLRRVLWSVFVFADLDSCPLLILPSTRRDSQGSGR